MRRSEHREPARRLRVVAPPLLGVHLHHRNVLVGRGVENDLRLLGGEERVHLVPVVHVVHQRNAARVAHAAVDLVERVLPALDHQHLPRARRGDLPDNLRAYRPARAGHHHDLPREEAARDGVVEVLDVPLEKRVLLHAARPVHAPQHPDPDDADRRQEEADHRYRVRRADVRERHVWKEVPHKREDAAREHHRADVLRKLASAHPAPREAVASEDEQRGEMHRAHDDVQARDGGPSTERRRLLEVEAERERAQVRKADHRRVGENPDDARREKGNPGLAGSRHVRTQAPSGCRSRTARRGASRPCRGSRPCRS